MLRTGMLKDRKKKETYKSGGRRRRQVGFIFDRDQEVERSGCGELVQPDSRGGWCEEDSGGEEDAEDEGRAEDQEVEDENCC